MSIFGATGQPHETREPSFGFWCRSYAMLVKEFIQLRRDRVSFAMIVMIPVMQLLLFGYAINTTPRHLPTAVLIQEDSDLARSVLKALENTSYFRFTREVHSVAEFDDLLQSGKVLFAVEIPRGFERAVRRGDRPALLVAADATDPVASGTALGSLGVIVQTALAHDLHIGDPPAMPFEIRAHAGYTFSTIVQNQLQAMQMSMMFFLPSILLSGFMFPFAGMPVWAQYLGEGLPLAHYIRIVRAIMLKGAAPSNLQYDTIALIALMLVAMTIAVTRFRRTLD